MGSEWLVRDDFGIKFLVTFSGLYTFHLHSSHYIGCSQHVWLSRCGMSKDAADQWVRVTEWLSSVAVRAPSMTLTKMVHQFVLGFGTGHIGHTPFTLFTRCPESSQVFDLPGCDRWDVCYVLLCASMWPKAIFFSLLFSSNSVDSDNFVHFLVHSKPNSWILGR